MPKDKEFLRHDEVLAYLERYIEHFDLRRHIRVGHPVEACEKVEGGTLRYASEIRITDRGCLMCHPRNKEGDLVGGVSYRALLAR
jgi:cation diffusion facilitator CzcD-associated flavoprotein CzcO